MRQLTPYQRRETVWDFMSDVERAFEDFWKVPTTGETANHLPRFTPAVDLTETNDSYLIHVDLPGVNEKDIKVDVSNGRLSVSGERRQEKREESKGFLRTERSYGRFERTFQLPQDVNQERIKAHLQNGVLELIIPKIEIAKPRTVQIEAR